MLLRRILSAAPDGSSSGGSSKPQKPCKDILLRIVPPYDKRCHDIYARVPSDSSNTSLTVTTILHINCQHAQKSATRDCYPSLDQKVRRVKLLGIRFFPPSSLAISDIFPGHHAHRFQGTREQSRDGVTRNYHMLVVRRTLRARSFG